MAILQITDCNGWQTNVVRCTSSLQVITSTTAWRFCSHKAKPSWQFHSHKFAKLSCWFSNFWATQQFHSQCVYQQSIVTGPYFVVNCCGSNGRFHLFFWLNIFSINATFPDRAASKRSCSFPIENMGHGWHSRNELFQRTRKRHNTHDFTFPLLRHDRLNH